MSLLDKASLVQIPSGYKEDKLHSVVPDSGAGDFTFSRSSTGTRVNSEGLIEEVPWNQLTYSEDFSSWATWQQGAALPVTVTTDAAESPIGTLTADRIQCDQVSLGSPNRVGVYQNVLFGDGQRFTISVWAKSASGSDEIFSIVARGATGITPGGFTATNEWQKFSRVVEMRDPAIAVNVIIGLYQNINTTTTDIYLWGAQIDLGETEKTYIKTTDRLDVPRLDYSGGATCPTLLLEPQRTNLALGSENLSLTYWNTSAGSSMVNDTTISPDGTQNASTLTFGSSSGSQYEASFAGSYGNQTHTVSCYVKVASGTAKFRFKCTHWGVADFYSNDYTATDEWQRFTFSKTFTASGGTGIIAGLKNETAGGSKDILVYGFQLESNASYATSYIPTSGSTTTRTADVSETSGLSSLINSQEGVLFLEIKSLGFDTQNRVISIYDGISTNGHLNRVQIGYSGSDQISFLYRTISGNVFLQNINVTQQQTNKFALKYKENDFSAYINGVKVAEQLSGSVVAVGTFTNIATHNGNDASNFFGKCNQLILFNEALTDAELTALTTI